VYGIWEAKDIQDNLTKEVAKKFKDGYPKENILFQTPQRLQLYRHGELSYDADISQSPAKLIEGVERFFNYQPPAYQQWEEAIVKFKERVGELGTTLVGIITKELQTNKPFKEAFETFGKLCRSSINPNLADAAIIDSPYAKVSKVPVSGLSVANSRNAPTGASVTGFGNSLRSVPKQLELA
jgi:hypothetical protein